MIQITYHPIIYCFVYIKHNILSKVLIIYRHLTPLNVFWFPKSRNKFMLIVLEVSSFTIQLQNIAKLICILLSVVVVRQQSKLVILFIISLYCFQIIKTSLKTLTIDALLLTAIILTLNKLNHYQIIKGHSFFLLQDIIMYI